MCNMVHSHKNVVLDVLPLLTQTYHKVEEYVAQIGEVLELEPRAPLQPFQENMDPNSAKRLKGFEEITKRK